jgi:hypothetical protein
MIEIKTPLALLIGYQEITNKEDITCKIHNILII